MVIDTRLVSSSSDSGFALAADLFGPSTGVGAIGHYGPIAVVVSPPPSAPRSTIGAVGGLVVGLFAPPLLLAGVVGAGIGAGVAKIAKHHDEKKLGVDAQEWLPADSSAIVAVVDDRYLDRIDAAFEKATKKIGKAVDKGDYDDVVKAVNEGDEKIVEAIES
jgi:uncharacterized membrane protein